ALAAATLAPALSAAAASTYPDRPIRFIVPLAPGGAVDIAARAIAQQLAINLRQQVVVDNRAGGGGNIGADIAAKAPSDGYTMVMGSSSNFGVNPTLYKHLPYDAVRDFTPVSLVSFAPNALFVHPSVPAQTVKELVALAKSKPGTLNFASSGQGGSNHLAGELFKMVAGVDIVHVPYKGTGPALADTIGGQVQMQFGSVIAVLPHLRAGKLRALAVTVPKRVAALPQVPTMAEAGYPAVETTVWNGVLVPARTPAAIVGRLNAEIVAILKEPAIRERFAAQGAEAVGSSSAEFAAHIRREIDKWGKVVRAAGLTVM
ncbi:MAG TPA: tripartite tricarboxylate transporter substrate binding protein, partial [Burkholderiales bacterium]|nr:tripartite tricarboxylate transporter substrate binding protein [Burkholderiales bacterium]